VDELRGAAESLRASERRLVAQSDALTELTARYTNPGELFADRLRSILDIATRALDVERLSMWEFDADHSLIRCVGLYHRTSSRYESGAVLPRTVAPAYFDAIERERVVAASEAQTDSRTREFRDVYLVPNNIGAMLDVPLQADNHRVGVLCAEHLGNARAWTVDEQNFGISVANLIVIALAEEQRRTTLKRLAESDARAHDRRHRTRRLHRHRLDRVHRHLECAGRGNVWMGTRRSRRQTSDRDDQFRRHTGTVTTTACTGFTKPAKRRWSNSASS
jgi:GAF domain-containing protein